MSREIWPALNAAGMLEGEARFRKAEPNPGLAKLAVAIENDPVHGCAGRNHQPITV